MGKLIILATTAVLLAILTGCEQQQPVSYKGKTQITIIFTATPDLVAEGDRIFASHAKWMGKTHYREGEKALLRYNLVKGSELSNPMDPSSEPTGNTSFVLMEVYESPAGLEDHWKQAAENWEDFAAVGEWVSKVKVTTVHGSPVIYSLW
jgi:quinol monooxygenase YgiN